MLHCKLSGQIYSTKIDSKPHSLHLQGVALRHAHTYSYRQKYTHTKVAPWNLKDELSYVPDLLSFILVLLE